MVFDICTGRESGVFLFFNLVFFSVCGPILFSYITAQPLGILLYTNQNGYHFGKNPEKINSLCTVKRMQISSVIVKIHKRCSQVFQNTVSV